MEVLILIRVVLIGILLLSQGYAQSNKIDEKTSLMWQDIPENRGVILTWFEAKEYCEELDQDNYDDWWLPSESELASIVNIDKKEGRKIQKGLRYFKPKSYWTSSTYSWNAPHAWAVEFNQGSSYSMKKEKRLFFRCVRCMDFHQCIDKFYKN